MWRPKNWKNRYKTKSRPNNSYATIYEAGADAMLEALKSEPPVAVSLPCYIDSNYINIGGKWYRIVFTPDE